MRAVLFGSNVYTWASMMDGDSKSHPMGVMMEGTHRIGQELFPRSPEWDSLSVFIQTLQSITH